MTSQETLLVTTNSIWVTGIGILRTRKKVREAMEIGATLFKKCKVTGQCQKADFENHKWITI